MQRIELDFPTVIRVITREHHKVVTSTYRKSDGRKIGGDYAYCTSADQADRIFAEFAAR